MKICLTGGPSGGKTTLAQAIQKEFSQAIMVVPEAASLIFGGGWPRRKTMSGVRHQQRAIYFVQRELESLLLEETPETVLVCDRGSIDALAYWPGKQSEFFADVKSTQRKEFKRYDWILHLDTAPIGHYDTTNPLRNETFEEAWRLNEKVKSAWEAHPRRFIIESDPDGHFIDKVQRTLEVIRMILDGKSYQTINRMLKKWKPMK